MRIKNAVVHGPLCIQWINETDGELTQPVLFTWEDDEGPQEFIALKGTRFDSASVPFLLQWVVPRWGMIRVGALIHDCAFKMRFQLAGQQPDRKVNRKYADQLLYCFARATGCDPVRAYLARYAVRYFGEKTWDRHDHEYRSQ